MDPNANLEEQRRIIEGIHRGENGSKAYQRLAELVQALDEWISKGGFLPRQWQGKGPAHAYAPLK